MKFASDDLRALFSPWYAFLGVTVSALFYCGVKAAAGELTPAQNAFGWFAAVVMMFLAHGLWYAWRLSKEDAQTTHRLLIKYVQKGLEGLKDEDIQDSQDK
jgi:hypothetical protein